MSEESPPKRAKTEVPKAVADIPADQLAYLCDGHGCGVDSDVRHGGEGESDLLTHLSEVRMVLKEELHCTDAGLLGAALFHSIYGTEGFQGKTLALTERPTLKALIGEEGEFLAYLNCVMDRATLDAAVYKLSAAVIAAAAAAAAGEEAAASSTAYTVFSREELGKDEIVLTVKQLKGLMQVHLADWCQQVHAYSFWNYRRDAYATIAQTLGGVNAEVHSKIMATEPKDYEDKLPEMVQARKLGVFKEVMSGDIDYNDLYDGKIPDDVIAKANEPASATATAE